jgi:hypothetical protein
MEHCDDPEVRVVWTFNGSFSRGRRGERDCAEERDPQRGAVRQTAFVSVNLAG